MELKDALARLDPANPAHWTETGKPSIEAVKEISGDKGVTRAQLNEAAPDLTRDTAKTKDGEKTKQEEQRAADLGKGGPEPETAKSRFDDIQAKANAARQANEPERAEPSLSAAIPAGAVETEAGPVPGETRFFTDAPDKPREFAALPDARARAVAQLGADDPRLEPIVKHMEARDRRERTQSREDRIRSADTVHRAERDRYLENSHIARARGSHNAPDWVVNASFITKEVREYGGKIYEAGEIIRGYTGRLPITAVLVT